jgi:ABC-type transport system involved in cytochrome c biogenesis permease subunit
MADSGLLMSHIALILVGDSLFALAFIVSLIYIFQERRIKLKKNLMLFNEKGDKDKINKSNEVFYLGKGYNLELLDNMNYQCLKFGFPTLTAGIIIGIYLSGTLFNSTVSVKPIEVISLITWLVYAVLLHERIAKGARGKKAAIFSIIGFIMILATVALSLYLFPQFHGVR